MSQATTPPSAVRLAAIDVGSNSLHMVIAQVATAFAGFAGIVIAIGSRWAGGCTSGHGISGTLQLAVSSWLAAVCFFVGGIATALLLYRSGR